MTKCKLSTRVLLKFEISLYPQLKQCKWIVECISLAIKDSYFSLSFISS